MTDLFEPGNLHVWLNSFVELSAFTASICFIVGLKRLSSPATARSGNSVAAVGMLIAVVGAALEGRGENLIWILFAIAVGAWPGWILARRVPMTSMPQMVSLFNGMGGACALLISLSETIHGAGLAASSSVLGILFGGLSFTGSLVAYGKLEGVVSEKPIRWPLQTWTSVGLVLILASAAGAWLSIGSSFALGAVVVVSLILGITQVLPIGGADMPVVISVLNSCTGLAAAITGFAVQNMAMIIAGTLVGAAGSLLTLLMCRAMNRPLSNVLFGAFGAAASANSGVDGGAGSVAGAEHRNMREISASETAILMAYSRRVIVVPGYGLAVAQAQHLVHELEEMLERRNVDVKYAIHPIAGRMPGHMNVLLAEANVPYPKLLDLEDVNREFVTTDVVLVVGANDVVNPAARTDTASPIYGMPILNVDSAKNVIVLKRGRGVGFAGIENGLFFDPKTRMLFGDAKGTLQNLIGELKSI